MIAMFEFLEKSNMISSAIFFAFPYGLIGTCKGTWTLDDKSYSKKVVVLTNFVSIQSELQFQGRKTESRKSAENIYLTCSVSSVIGIFFGSPYVAHVLE